MSKKNIEVGKRIREIRKRVGLNQTDLGKALGGLTAVAISTYEAGRIPRGELLKKIAELGHVSVDWLLTGKELYREKQTEVAFIREGGYLSEQEKELRELLRENPEILPLLRKYSALKESVAGLNMEIVLSPKTT